ncbi:TlpA disulfide reductase family protein [Magnetovibrio sp.]|uniref:TlpA disulfide reductase family protein n=1 Tax=Magnetovibrio sp. TaxID=2024836 RepID=UPI002F95318B
MSYRTPLIVVAAVLSIAIGGGFLYQKAPSTSGEAQAPQQSVRSAADGLAGFSLLVDPPMVPSVVMKDEAGAETTLEAYRGKVVLLNLWATWCPPCIREMPDLNALQKDFAGRDFAVVPVASGKQGREDAAEFLRARNLDALKTYYDPRSLFLRAFDLETLPTTFLIDRDGRMRGGVLGMTNWHSDEGKALIEALLNENG